MHGFLIEIIIIMHLRVAAERIRKLAVQHMVLIRLDRPLKSRMKIIRHLRGIKDPYILRQPCVECKCDPRRLNSRFHIEHCDISLSVDSGVRAACTERPDFLSEEIFDRFLQYILNGDAVHLALIAVIIRAVIGDD